MPQQETVQRFSLEPAPPGRLSRAVDRRRRLQHRHLDAERRCGLADDLADAFAAVGRTHADGHQPAGLPGRPPGGDACRCRRPAQAVARHPGVDAPGRPCPGRAHLAGLVSAWALLALTFLLGIGAALSGPAWQAIIPDLVEREEIAPAVALDAMGINVARAVGPALGGLWSPPPVREPSSC